MSKSPIEVLYENIKEQDIVSLTEGVSVTNDVVKMVEFKNIKPIHFNEVSCNVDFISIENHIADMVNGNTILFKIDLSQGYLEIDETESSYTIKYIKYSDAVMTSNLAAAYAYPLIDVDLSEKEQITMTGVTKYNVAKVFITPTVFDQKTLVKTVNGSYNDVVVYVGQFINTLASLKDLIVSIATKEPATTLYINRVDSLFKVLGLGVNGVIVKICKVFEFDSEIDDDLETIIEYDVLNKEPYILLTDKDIVLIAGRAFKDGQMIGTEERYDVVFSNNDKITSSEVYKLKESRYNLQSYVKNITPDITEEMYNECTLAADKLSNSVIALTAILDQLNPEGSIYKLFRGSSFSLDRDELGSEAIFANEFMKALNSTKAVPLFEETTEQEAIQE